MSLIHKFLEKKVFINDCNNARSVTKRQVKKALNLLKQGKYQELITWYNSVPRIRNKKYSKYKYLPIQDLIMKKQGCAYCSIDPSFYSDFEIKVVYENADFVLIDKLLHTLDNSQSVDEVLKRASSRLSPDGVIIVKEWKGTDTMMEVVDLFNMCVLRSSYTIEEFQETTGMYLAFAEWKQLFEELGYTVLDSKFQDDMYQSFYLVLKPAPAVGQKLMVEE